MLEYAIALLLAKEGSAFTLSRVAVHMFEYAIALLLAKMSCDRHRITLTLAEYKRVPGEL